MEKKSKMTTKIRNKTSMPTLSPPFSTGFGLLSRAIRQVKNIRFIQTGKEEFKVSLFADELILYIRDIKDTTRNLLQLINCIQQSCRTQKSAAFLCTSDKHTEKESRETIPFTVGINNLRINTIKKGKVLFNEDLKTLKEEMKEDPRQWKDFPLTSPLPAGLILGNGHFPKQSVDTVRSFPSRFQCNSPQKLKK